jgi:fructose 1,6-bisphosphate aldolase/phosphatase
MLAPAMSQGFQFTIMDVSYTEGDRVVELNAPEDLYDITALLRDNERFVIESIHSRNNMEECASVSTDRLSLIAGRYTGKDDPVMLVRTQGSFPATGEVLSPFRLGHYVAGYMRGSHTGPLMPVKQNSTISFFDGPPVVSCAAFCVHNGKLTGLLGSGNATLLGARVRRHCREAWKAGDEIQGPLGKDLKEEEK